MNATAPRGAGVQRSDAQLVRRAARVIAIQTAAAVAVVVAGVAVLVLLLTVREQHADAQRMVRTAALTAEDVADPPANVHLLLRTPDGVVRVSARTPAGLTGIAIDDLPPGFSDIQVPEGRPGEEHEYAVYVVDRDGSRLVAAVDNRYRAAETERLASPLLIAGSLGIAAAAAVGWLVGMRAVRPLGSALALQRRFVADASHELRTPLTVLHTRAQMLARRSDVDERTHGELVRLVDDAKVLADIVSDLLLSAEMQHRPDRREPVDLVELSRRVADSFGAAAEQAGVALVVDAPADEPITVAGVPVALRRAVNALVDNALEHTTQGDSVTLRVTHRGESAVLAVADTGEGLDPAAANALTERFARGSHAPAGKRVGLGLALVREVVHAHGGTISLDGQPGAGATATITLPLA